MATAININKRKGKVGQALYVDNDEGIMAFADQIFDPNNNEFISAFIEQLKNTTVNGKSLFNTFKTNITVSTSGSNVSQLTDSDIKDVLIHFFDDGDSDDIYTYSNGKVVKKI